MENQTVDIEYNQQNIQEMQYNPKREHNIELGTESTHHEYQDKYDYDLEQEGHGLLMNKSQVRYKFIQKVYSIITCQLALTSLLVFLALQSFWFAQNVAQSSFLLSFAFIGYFATTIILVCFREQARKVPNNYIWLFIFTLCLSLLVSSICSHYAWTQEGIKNIQGQQIVLQAAGLTLFVTLSLTLFAFYTDKDYTVFGAGLFLSFVSIFFFGIFAILSGAQLMITLYLILSVLIYGFYLIFDTQLLMDRKSLHLDIDDYILGAVFIYTDIIMLFLRILEILARAQNN
ncbi:hypothetical protein PPERSA_00558 [Pseudocohnilembus persalinus]|uniref:Bax inhibitor 1-related n=1 Tax=Pseudocohnilembus persalinus TaxID=266149 RepID=A0A0V0QSF8_PSEPJ|nr:hypothetical protein PPERSA_00558 [Pseudocohnilembus persalinus]|eukprot:KRX05257.1 hypothetical protein PPERSA_00558 [Pseudocohnilembus persalinus]